MLKDYYKILGVERTASQKDIKNAFYRLMNIFHPDKINGDETASAEFYEVQEAYKILGDLDNRLQYSILINQDLIEKALLHKRIDIPGFTVKTVRQKKKTS